MKINGSGYRMGYAKSQDGKKWDRNDSKAELSVSPDGWDSKAIDKMEAIHHNGNIYMFYNGNGFGYDGIGLAIMEDGLLFQTN